MMILDSGLLFWPPCILKKPMRTVLFHRLPFHCHSAEACLTTRTYSAVLKSCAERFNSQGHRTLLLLESEFNLCSVRQIKLALLG